MSIKKAHAKLQTLVRQNLGKKDCLLIEKAYYFARDCHEGARRESGEPYLIHPIQVAIILAGMGLDGETLAAALLHDVCEDTNATTEQIEATFGKNIAHLVEAVTKLEKVKMKRSQTFAPSFLSTTEERFSAGNQVESLRKMLLAMTDDIRVILIKLADRLHNMRTLASLRPDKRARIAQETLEVYAPLANRLGMGEIKGQLEDLAFPYAYPKEFSSLKSIAEDHIGHRERFTKDFIAILRGFFSREKVRITDIHGRAKHTYSLWKKLSRYQGDIGKIYDLIAIRILVPEVSDCYHTLGLIHSRWNPLLGRIKDYIANPKPNGYQSLHTTIFGDGGEICEIQIRTNAMHAQAEQGIAAHWQYSEVKNTKLRNQSQAAPEWIKELRDLNKAFKDPNEFRKALTIDVFSDRIFVFTPEGDVVDLPAETTSIDFAYAVHSDIGDQCVGAKINGKIKPLNTPLANGDIVEILISKTSSPKRDWLSFVKTQRARSKIKAYLNL